MQIARKQARTTSKYAIAKYTQVFSTSNIAASQRTKTIFFLIVPVPVDPPQLLAIVARQSLSLFLQQKVPDQT